MKYNIIGKYKFSKIEIIDTAKDKKEAEYLVREYSMSFGYDWHIYYKQIK